MEMTTPAAVRMQCINAKNATRLPFVEIRIETIVGQWQNWRTYLIMVGKSGVFTRIILRNIKKYINDLDNTKMKNSKHSPQHLGDALLLMLQIICEVDTS